MRKKFIIQECRKRAFYALVKERLDLANFLNLVEETGFGLRNRVGLVTGKITYDVEAVTLYKMFWVGRIIYNEYYNNITIMNIKFKLVNFPLLFRMIS